MCGDFGHTERQKRSEKKMREENRLMKDNKKIAVIILVIFMVASISSIRYTLLNATDINYRNSDATYHVLLTMKAYDETPISVHKFLPIVSLGKESDKGIPWGYTIADKYGNYYYTSFSPAGFVLPYCFIKIAHLPICISSIYIFNTILCIISAIFLYLILKEVFSETIGILMGIFLYCLTPEIFHGMGIVYWHQSILQVMLLLQIYCYNKYTASKIAKFLFWLTCLINPYIEWTGYVANIGFIIVEVIKNWKKDRKLSIKRGMLLSGITACSFGLFCIHYLLVVNAHEFFNALKIRFFSRSITEDSRITDLLGGYVSSFWNIWIILVILFVILLVKYRGVSWIYVSEFRKHKTLVFLLVFPVLENFIMKEHAISYTYDKMKFSFLLIFSFVDLFCIAFGGKKRNRLKYIVAILCIGLCAESCKKYMQEYVWEAAYIKDNEIVKEYIEENYPKNIMGMEYSVRGYLNCVFEKGIWENINNLVILKFVACLENENRYYVLLKEKNVGGIDGWNMYAFSAEIYDEYTGKSQIVDSSQGNLNASEWGIRALDYTNEEWESGINRESKKTIICIYNEKIYRRLKKEAAFICNNLQYNIEDLKCDEYCMYVTVDRDATDCCYPNVITMK